MDIQPTIDNQQMLPKGTVLHGTYRIERYLASGGFGNTYVATNEFDELVVIKEFFMRGVTERGDDQKTVTVTETNAALFRQQRAKFVKEAKRMRTLNNPHVVRIHALFEENETAYYVMDYIDGQSLSAELKQQGHPYTEKEVADILQALAYALQAVHAKSIQHLDVKPGNIMRDRQGNIFLIDFGASKQLGPAGAATSTSSSMCYTPGYAAVEQQDQLLDSIGPWTDIYAVGATAYNLLTNQRPPLPSEVILNGPSAFHFPSSVSEHMQHFITTCMSPSYRQRPQSVAEMLELLKEEPKVAEVSEKTISYQEPACVYGPPPVYNQETVGTSTPQPDETKKKKSKKGPAVTPKKKSNIPKIAIGALLGVVLVVLAIVLFKGKDDSTKNADNLSIPDDIETDTNPTTDSETGATESSLPSRETITVKGVSFDMIKVERGTFLMGAQNRDSVIAHFDKDAEIFEGPVHEETIRTFYIGETEVTQELWQAVMGWNYSQFKGSQKPVENVSWNNCQTFIDSLNSCTGRKFRLPTEAEWEYAARGGNQSKDYKYSGSNTLKDVAWYNANSSSTTHPVKKKAPNELGLYDMSGNVWEWTSSYWRNDYNASEDRSRCVMRGDCWMGNEKGMRVTYRHRSVPGSRFEYFGLRLALDPQ